MRQWDGQPLPDSLAGDLELAFIKPDAKIWASPRRFDRHGESGLAFSELLPHTARSADDLCVVRSMTTDQINHHTGPAHDGLRHPVRRSSLDGCLGDLRLG